MKLYLFFILSIGVYAWAELPDTVSDKAINTNLEHLDLKATKVQKGLDAVVNTSGFVNVGVTSVITCTGSTSCTATCPTDHIALNGGCEVNWGSPPSNITNWSPNGRSWYCYSNTASSVNGKVVCGKLR